MSAAAVASPPAVSPSREIRMSASAVASPPSAQMPPPGKAEKKSDTTSRATMSAPTAPTAEINMSDERKRGHGEDVPAKTAVAKFTPKYDFCSVDPSTVTLGELNWNKRAVTHVFFDKSFSIRIGSWEHPAVANWYLNTPYNQTGTPTPIHEFLSSIELAKKDNDYYKENSSKLNYTFDLKIFHRVEEYRNFFTDLHTVIAKSCKTNNWFEKTLSHEHIMFIIKDSLQQKRDFEFVRVKVVPTGLPNAPSIRLKVGENDKGPIWRNITTTDMLSLDEGGNGLIRNANVVAVVEEVGVWVKNDPSVGVKYRLAQILIIPSDKPLASNSRSTNRSEDAFSALIPGGVQFE